MNFLDLFSIPGHAKFYTYPTYNSRKTKINRQCLNMIVNISLKLTPTSHLLVNTKCIL